MDKILTVNDVATILQVKAITVREMFREKRLRGFKVGKAWRTTETMLQEDIDALARGESPAELPSPDTTSATGAAPAKDVPTEAPKGPAPQIKRPDEAAAPAARAAKKPREKPATALDEDEDTQQMLF